MLVESDHRTTCPFKGEASHSSVSVGTTVLENALWWYPHPMDEVAGLAGYAAFYADRLEVTASIAFGGGDEATVRLPMWGTVDDLVGVMDVDEVGDGRYVAPTYPNPPSGPSSTWSGTSSGAWWSKAASCSVRRSSGRPRLDRTST